MNEIEELQRLRTWVDTTASDQKRKAELFNKAQEETRTERIAFFEKIALFDAGAIAASITYAGFYKDHTALMHGKACLEIGWGLLLLGMITSYIRNLSSQSQRYHHFASMWVKA